MNDKVLVTYFSASGITAGIAKELADKINADIFEIQPQNPYTSADLNWMDKKVVALWKCLILPVAQKLQNK